VKYAADHARIQMHTVITVYLASLSRKTLSHIAYLNNGVTLRPTKALWERIGCSPSKSADKHAFYQQ